MERSGEVILRRELYDDSSNYSIGTYVRVAGYMHAIDPLCGICRVEHESHLLDVDLKLVVTPGITLTSLYHIIGELRPSSERVSTHAHTHLWLLSCLLSTPLTLLLLLPKMWSWHNPSPLYLQARICRRADGFDMKLYEAALVKRRRFLKVTPQSTGSLVK